MAKKIRIDNALLKRQRRKEVKRQPVKKTSCRILVVCEGVKTEPNYFKKFRTSENDYFVYDLECDGKGFNTVKVVDAAISKKCAAERCGAPYDSVWAVFDKDDFPDNNFNGAIIKAMDNNINVAWSNEAFELWYLYHFHNRITAMRRTEYQRAISEAVNNSEKWINKKAYKYEKNDPNNYNIMCRYGDQEAAIRRAESQHSTFDNKKYASHNPCTTVYKLVLQLLNRDEELINQVMAKINS